MPYQFLTIKKMKRLKIKRIDKFTNQNSDQCDGGGELGVTQPVELIISLCQLCVCSFLPLSSIVTVKTFVNSNHVEYFGRWLLNLRLEVGGKERVILTPQKMRLEFAINVSCEYVLRVLGALLLLKMYFCSQKNK